MPVSRIVISTSFVAGSVVRETRTFPCSGVAGRLVSTAATAGHRQYTVGHFGGAGGRIVDSLKGFFARGIVLVSHPNFGIVQDGHQEIIEFVSCCAREFAQRGHPLRMLELSLQRLNDVRRLVPTGLDRPNGCLMRYGVGRVRHRLHCIPWLESLIRSSSDG